jgi:hypothetical protein
MAADPRVASLVPRDKSKTLFLYLILLLYIQIISIINFSNYVEISILNKMT